jgi:hypothetical protein
LPQPRRRQPAAGSRPCTPSTRAPAPRPSPTPPPPPQADSYSYCPHYALAWHYRKLNLLNELVRYRADIMCLQEVQSDHFSDFLAPELQKHGYASIYKKKTAEM